MSKSPFTQKSFLKISLLSLFVSIAAIGGCAVSAKNADESAAGSAIKSANVQENRSVSQNLTKNSSAKTTIQITAGSPADAVRIFYKNLREKRFREAMMMTNLRPAIENLSDAEMQDLSRDFEPLAAAVPAELQIKGEIVANNTATVTTQMPNEEGQPELKEIPLRRENNSWILLTADEKEEATAKKEGSNYFFVLRIETHHGEVQSAMQEIARKEAAYAIKNGGSFADMQTLVAENFLSPDLQRVESVGYKFSVVASADKKSYYATAEPAIYGKTGKLSFLLEYDTSSPKPRLKFEDNKGNSLKK